MSLEYINDIWREYPNSAEHFTEVSRPVHNILQELSPDQIFLFDFPIVSAVRSSDEEFWCKTLDREDPQPQIADMCWRLKSINRTHLLFARETANYNRKLCELALGVSPAVAQIFARTTIQKCLDLSQTVNAPLFALREGRNESFWGNVALCRNAKDHLASLVNELFRNKAFRGDYSCVEMAPATASVV